MQTQRTSSTCMFSSFVLRVDTVSQMKFEQKLSMTSCCKSQIINLALQVLTFLVVLVIIAASILRSISLSSYLYSQGAMSLLP